MEVQQSRSSRINIHPDWQEGWRQAAGAKRMHSKAVAGGPGVGKAVARGLGDLHLHKLEGTTWEQDRPPNPGFQCREIKPQNLWL